MGRAYRLVVIREFAAHSDGRGQLVDALLQLLVSTPERPSPVVRLPRVEEEDKQATEARELAVVPIHRGGELIDGGR